MEHLRLDKVLVHLRIDLIVLARFVLECRRQGLAVGGELVSFLLPGPIRAVSTDIPYFVLGVFAFDSRFGLVAVVLSDAAEPIEGRREGRVVGEVKHRGPPPHRVDFVAKRVEGTVVRVELAQSTLPFCGVQLEAGEHLRRVAIEYGVVHFQREIDVQEQLTIAVGRCLEFHIKAAGINGGGTYAGVGLLSCHSGC